VTRPLADPVISLEQLDELITWHCARERAALGVTLQRHLAAFEEVTGLLLAEAPMPGGPFPLDLLPRWPDRGQRGAVRLAAMLRRDIKAGAIPPGVMLPVAAEMAARYGVVIRTVRRATGMLRSDGLLARRPVNGIEGTRGTRLYVVEPEQRRAPVTT
jgi:hypothetical protein